MKKLPHSWPDVLRRESLWHHRIRVWGFDRTGVLLLLAGCSFSPFQKNRKSAVLLLLFVVVVSVGIKTTSVTETMRKRNKYNNNRREKKSTERWRHQQTPTKQNVIEFALLFEEIQDTTTRIMREMTINGEEENCEEQQQESVTQLVTVSNANSLIRFSLPSSSQRTFPQISSSKGFGSPETQSWETESESPGGWVYQRQKNFLLLLLHKTLKDGRCSRWSSSW
jgi:hypothetical protein